jgi:hypothetical protein
MLPAFAETSIGPGFLDIFESETPPTIENLKAFASLEGTKDT